METYDMSPDQLLAAFLDACRDFDRDAATDALHELRYRVWAGSPLPSDIRPHPEEQAELRRISALWREERRKQTGGVPTKSLNERTRDSGMGFHAIPRMKLNDEPLPWNRLSTTGAQLRRKEHYPFCVDPAACIANGHRCPRDPVCGTPI